LKDFYQKYLGKRWLINEEFKTFGKLSPEEKKEKWAYLSSLKNSIEAEFRIINQKLKLEEINNHCEKKLLIIEHHEKN
jgi:phenylalanyl-tRNA synthetase alpha subunit